MIAHAGSFERKIKKEKLKIKKEERDERKEQPPLCFAAPLE